MTSEPTPTGERIAKRIARSGVCSRRDAEKLIEAGKVRVDGKIITSPALNVTDENIILVNNKPINAAGTTRLWLYHKPAGLVTTHKDTHDRPTVFKAMPTDMPRVISIGRLDLNSEGLLLLTNDGELSRHIELPATGWIRRYRVRVFKIPTPATIAKLAAGVTIEGITYGSIEVKVEKQTRSNSWLIVGLKEGKNRELRKVFEHFGHPVSRLIRISYGPFQIGSLKKGELKEVPERVLKEQLGKFMKPQGETKQ